MEAGLPGISDWVTYSAKGGSIAVDWWQGFDGIRNYSLKIEGMGVSRGPENAQAFVSIAHYNSLVFIILLTTEWRWLMH